MTSKLTAGVRAFQEAFGHPVLSVPTVPSQERLKLRLRLVAEEFVELLAASGCEGWGSLESTILDVVETAGNAQVDLVEIADALGDIEYVCTGMALELGIDLDAVIEEIDASNRTKFGAPLRPDGKITKGPNFRAPDIARVLREQVKP